MSDYKFLSIGLGLVLAYVCILLLIGAYQEWRHTKRNPKQTVSKSLKGRIKQ